MLLKVTWVKEGTYSIRDPEYGWEICIDPEAQEHEQRLLQTLANDMNALLMAEVEDG